MGNEMKTGHQAPYLRDNYLFCVKCTAIVVYVLILCFKINENDSAYNVAVCKKRDTKR